MKYVYQFMAGSDEAQQFRLAFEVNVAKHMHVVTDVEVYHTNNHEYCGLQTFPSSSNRFSILAISRIGNFKFNIDIYINPSGCDIIIIEKVPTTIASVENLQPCNAIQ